MDKVLQNYYTKSANLKEYMVSMLNPTKEDLILEPCGGTGEFIDSILRINSLQRIDTIDINSNDVQLLKKKYSHQKNIKVRKGDTLLDETFNLDSNIGGIYDKIIGNPPYGAWFDYNYRKQLKELYKDLYVKESYLLFLIRSIFLLKNQGRLVFIIPDTFLYLNSYRKIRTFILEHTRLKEIITFPSSFFGSVDFQYSNLCIITLEKEQDLNITKNNVFKLITGFNDASQIGKNLILTNTNTVSYKQSTLLNTEDRAIMHSKIIYSLNKKADYMLGDIADCVTGIYTGNNKKYISVLSNSTDSRNTQGYSKISENEISYKYSLTGTLDNKDYVHLVKGSSNTRFIRADKWAIRWDENSIMHYTHDKKARFQNSSFYFQKGIAVPMLKGSRLIATIMNKKVFDQSIVGIFPKKEFNTHFYYVLAFLNSNIANKLIHAINPTVNNSANYLKKLPIILPDHSKYIEITILAKQLLNCPNNQEKLDKLNSYFDKIYKTV